MKEILEVLDGTMLDVTRAGSTETECIDTSQIFFVCFGNFDENNSDDSQKNSTLSHPPKSNNSPSLNSNVSSSNDSGNGSGEQKEFALKSISHQSSTSADYQR